MNVIASAEQITEVVSSLAKALQVKPLDAETMVMYQVGLSKLTQQELAHAGIELFKHWKEKGYPRCQDFLDRAMTLKRSEEPKALPEPARPEMAKMAQVGLHLMQSDAPRSEKLEHFRKMDRLFPGIGWAEEGMRLQKDFARIDKKREERPRHND